MRFEIEIGRGSFVHQDGTESGMRFVARLRVRGGDGTVLYEVRRKSRSQALEAARRWIVKGARTAVRIDRILAPRAPDVPPPKEEKP